MVTYSLETQTQQQQSSQVEPDATQQGAQRESHHVSIDTTRQVHCFRDDSEPRSHCTHACDTDDTDGMVYSSLNLQNINAPMPPKWKHNDHILEKYKKFCHSCQRIFEGPMGHVTSGKVKNQHVLNLVWSRWRGHKMKCMILTM